MALVIVSWGTVLSPEVAAALRPALAHLQPLPLSLAALLPVEVDAQACRRTLSAPSARHALQLPAVASLATVQIQRVDRLAVGRGGVDVVVLVLSRRPGRERKKKEREVVLLKVIILS